jgi:GT2 family glycosyltransferase
VNSDWKTLIITVNFRQDQCTLRFLNSATKLDGFGSCHLLIVDNDSDDSSVRSLRAASAEFGNVELLALPQNAGYFGGANWALRHYLERHRIPDWVVVCNNDVVFDNPRFLLRLYERDPGKMGMIAPAIISGVTGHDENPSIRHRPSEFRMWRYSFWLSSYHMMWFKQWLSPLVRRARYRLEKWTSHRHRGTGESIYAPSGAFLIFSRRFFEAGGFIDDGSFLYAEEFRVAEMCRYLGLSVIHDRELTAWHEGSQSTGRMLSRSVYLHQKEGFSYGLTRFKNSYPELGAKARSARTIVTNIATDRSTGATAEEGVR